MCRIIRMSLKKTLKKILPEFLVLGYHLCLAQLASLCYGQPSRHLVMIGITGTKGKSTTANFIWSVLQAGGYKTGLIGTANIKIGHTESLNPYHMTMPGPFVIQRLLRQMVKAGCTHCVMEVTSEGVKQWRHKGILYDVAIFTNLSPEHLPSHDGSFEKYKEAKGKLFASLNRSYRKYLLKQTIHTTIITNLDSKEANYFLSFPADRHTTVGVENSAAHLQAKHITNHPGGVSFMAGDALFKISILGTFNVANALLAIAVGRARGIPDSKIQSGLESLMIIPGRMEKIDEGQSFTVIVDYAHEKLSMTALLTAAKHITAGKIIILLGAEGGGRDPAKRPIMGKLAATYADHVIVSNVDPYEDDPTQIAEDIARAAEKAGKKRGQNLFVIEDRRAGIRKALELAHSEDLILITGKGAEQSIVIGGVSSPWDDRNVVREELRKLSSDH